MTERQLMHGLLAAAPLALLVGAAACGGGAATDRPGAADSTGRQSPPAGSAAVASAGSATPGPVVAVAAGAYYSCALLRAGDARCWGGRGDDPDEDDPSRAATPPGRWRAIATGAALACAIEDDGGGADSGGVRCWTPVGASDTAVACPPAAKPAARCAAAGAPGASSPRLTSLAVGRSHACGLTADGAITCWGENDLGQLGRGTAERQGGPAAVSAADSAGRPVHFTAVAAGSTTTCALAADGVPYCWGADQGAGLLGRPPEERCLSGKYPGGRAFAFYCTRAPRPVPTSLRFTALAVGARHACGLADGGRAYCWGMVPAPDAPLDAPPPPASDSARYAPRAVPGGQTFASLSAGYDFVCGVTTAGAALCWGDDEYGQLGRGSAAGATAPADAAAPAPVSGGLTFRAVSAGTDHACGLTTAGDAYCWGRNEEGQLGDSSTPGARRSSVPVRATVPGGGGQ